MITEVADLDIDKILEVETLSREAVAHFKEQVYSLKENREKLDAKINSMRAHLKKEHDGARAKDLTLLLGICEWVVGNVEEASVLLKEVKSRKIGSYYLGKCYQELGDYAEAMECFERAKKADAEEFDICMNIAETKRMAGNIEDALEIIKKFSKSHRDSAELHYQWGYCLDTLGEYDEAFSHYEQSLQIDQNYARSLFRCAFNYDLNGEDEKAIEYYERCINLCPSHINAYSNLGLLYEDKGNYDDAVYCFETILDAEPTNQRALLFLKDARSSGAMYYDEEISKKQGKESEVLNIPISDFELSVRSKNCLEKMNIYTLRDLTRITEADLLSFKNFGETSLNEIKVILSQKGLRLGHSLESGSETELFTNKSSEKKMQIFDAISELEFSTHCKNILSMLGIETVEDLVENTELELNQKGVNQDYINEIKDVLSKIGMNLKTNRNSAADLEDNDAEWPV
ncbi:MAG: tetratricopeptide repeat protein [Planctomycetia bacterium]|nr:tetratricopeptide repeat protein [Planctomycetia bacterium]